MSRIPIWAYFARLKAEGKTPREVYKPRHNRGPQGSKTRTAERTKKKKTPRLYP